MEWNDLVQNMYYSWAHVKVVMNLCVLQKEGKRLSALKTNSYSVKLKGKIYTSWPHQVQWTRLFVTKNCVFHCVGWHTDRFASHIAQ
jgi:hypothetical protein